MFYIVEIEDHVRVEPKLFGAPTQEAVDKQLRETYADYMDRELGKVIAVVEVMDVRDGVIIPGDGAVYYESRFKLLVWKPELHELVFGIIDEVVNFGAFMNLGATRGMIHVSQAMEDYVSFSKSNTLIGKSTKRSLKKGDLCLARIVSISYKADPPKIGLTMRQPGLGKIEWIKEDKRKEKAAAAKAARAEKSSKGKSKSKKK